MSKDTIEVFISYSKQDKELRDGLLAHLRPLETRGIITWHDRQILPGTRWDEEIKARLNAADIILLLISADFLNTEYCTQVEIPEALRRHEVGEATVMPVILRSCGWKYTPLAAIQAYPEKAKPIISWTYIDEAYTNVVDGVYLAATEIEKRREQQRQVAEQERLRRVEQLRQQQVAEAERLKQEELEQQNQSIEPSVPLNVVQVEVPSIAKTAEEVKAKLERIPLREQSQAEENAAVKSRAQELVTSSKKQTRDVPSSKRYLRGSEELEEVIKIVEKAYARKTRQHLNDVQRAIVQGTWYKLSYEKIANNSRYNRITLESSGPRLWDVLSDSLGEKINKNNFREVMKRQLSKSRILMSANEDRKVGRGTSIQICEYVSTISGHSSWINSIVVSSNRQIISGSQDSTVKLWDLDTGKYLRDLGKFWSKKHSDRIHSIAISSDSKILASASEDRTVIVWDLTTYGNLYPPLRHQGAVYCITISPDNQLLASGCSDHTVNIWDLKTGKQIKRFIERDSIRALAFSPDGQMLISASEDKIIKTWIVKNWASQNLSFDYESSPDSLALSKDGRILAISYKNRKIKVIDFHRREQLYPLTGEVVALSPDNEILATALDKEISLWKQETGELICSSVKAGNLVRSLAFSDDGLTLVSGQGEEIKTWRIRKDKLLP